MIIKVVLFFTLLVTTKLYAQEITVIVSEWPPYNFTKEDKVVGISTELIERALKKANIEYKLVIYPFKRALNTVQKTPYTMFYTVARTAELENKYKWIGPLHNIDVYLYKLNSRSDIKINSLADIKDYKTSVLMGGSVENFFMHNWFKEDINYDVKVNSKQLLKALFKNRTDLIPGDPLDLAYQMQEMGYKSSNIEKAYLLSNQVSYYMIANKKIEDSIITKIQKSLDEILATDEKQKIMKKYL